MYANLWMLCWGATAVYCENNVEHITILCERSAEFLSCITMIHNLSCVSWHPKPWNVMGYKGTALVILNSILHKKDVVSPMVQPPFLLDRKLAGTHSRCARSRKEKNPLSFPAISSPWPGLCTDGGNNVSCHSSAVSRWPFRSEARV